MFGLIYWIGAIVTFGGILTSLVLFKDQYKKEGCYPEVSEEVWVYGAITFIATLAWPVVIVTAVLGFLFILIGSFWKKVVDPDKDE